MYTVLKDSVLNEVNSNTFKTDMLFYISVNTF